jgi:hypothetical protein
MDGRTDGPVFTVASSSRLPGRGVRRTDSVLQFPDRVQENAFADGRTNEQTEGLYIVNERMTQTNVSPSHHVGAMTDPWADPWGSLWSQLQAWRQRKPGSGNAPITMRYRSSERVELPRPMHGDAPGCGQQLDNVQMLPMLMLYCCCCGSNDSCGCNRCRCNR